MISTWNIKKFSRCKVPLNKARNFNSNNNNNTWNHFLDNYLNIIFLLQRDGNENGHYGTLKVVKKEYHNILETIELTKNNIESLDFNLIKKDHLIGIQYRTKEEEVKIQFTFHNVNDSSSFFAFFSPYIPYRILSNDYSVTEETISSKNSISYTLHPSSSTANSSNSATIMPTSKSVVSTLTPPSTSTSTSPPTPISVVPNLIPNPNFNKINDINLPNLPNLPPPLPSSSSSSSSSSSFPSQLNPSQLNPSQLNPSQLNPSQLNSSQLNSSQFNPSQLNSSQLNSQLNLYSNSQLPTSSINVSQTNSKHDNIYSIFNSNNINTINDNLNKIPINNTNNTNINNNDNNNNNILNIDNITSSIDNEKSNKKNSLPKKNDNKKSTSNKKELNPDKSKTNRIEIENFSNHLEDLIPDLIQQQKINEQISLFLNLPNYQLLKYIFEILDNENFVKLVEKINELYSSYINE
ncbi:hypothetical protein U3516DRAFT_833002 [Neocallimastix sp. 'constans']